MDIGKSIQECNKAKGWDQSALADQMGVHRAAISTIKRRNSCHSDTLIALAKAYKIQVSEFIAAGEAEHG